MGVDIVAHAEAIASLKTVTVAAELLTVLEVHGPIIAAPMPGVRIVPDEIALLPPEQAVSLAYSLAYGLQSVIGRNFPAVEEAYKIALAVMGQQAVTGSASLAAHELLAARVAVLEGEVAVLMSQMTQALTNSASALDTVTELDDTSTLHEDRITALESA